MKIVSICAESFGSNTYLLVSGNEAMVVDPSVSVAAIMNAVSAENAALVGILLTHGHFDHILSLDTLRDAMGVKAYIHSNDAIMLTDGKKNAFYEFFGKERTYRPADVLLTDGDTIPLGGEVLTVIHTPGHTQGSVCYSYGDIIVTGDTLFAEAIGRCDLWGGSKELMADSLRHLSTLPRNTQIYPGHGPASKLWAALDNAAYFI